MVLVCSHGKGVVDLGSLQVISQLLRSLNKPLGSFVVLHNSKNLISDSLGCFLCVGLLNILVVVAQQGVAQQVLLFRFVRKGEV